MKTAVRSSIALLVSIVAVACSSSSSPSSGSGGGDAGNANADASGEDSASASGTDAQPDVIVDNSNCVMPGAASNANGIGGYCSPGGGQCVNAGPGGTPRDCSADTGSAVAHAWFCTYPCDGPSDTSCGAGASCISTESGIFCVPSACASLVPGEDAGAISDGSAPDAGTATDSAAAIDAPIDAPTSGG